MLGDKKVCAGKILSISAFKDKLYKGLSFTLSTFFSGCLPETNKQQPLPFS
jgi:hypothetical protein